MDARSPDYHLNRKEIEAEYGITARWLELATVKGDGPIMTKISRRMVRYRRADIEAWLESKRVENTAQTAA